MKTLLCIPTLNAASYSADIIRSIENQRTKPDRVQIIDSSSTDDGAAKFLVAGYQVHTIPRSQFNHGATRHLASVLNPWAEVIVFQTQDALLESAQSFGALVRHFENPRVGAAYGRQLPRPGATPIEAHARIYNYPDTDQTRTLQDVDTLGFRSIFISNSFAAYRTSAYLAVGGFADNVIMGEDTHLAARLLLADWNVAYSANARVFHSHDYSVWQEFSRYFDTGVFHARECWLRENFGGASGEGARFVKSELSYLRKHAPGLIGSALVRTVAKFAGYHLGLRERWLPSSAKRRLSMHSFYWKT